MHTVLLCSDAPAGWVTTAETADRLGIRPGSVKDLVDAGKLTTVKVGGRRWVDPASIDAYAATRGARRVSSGVELLDVRPAYVNGRGMRCGARLPLHALLAVIEFDTGRPVSVLEVSRQLDVAPSVIHRARRDGLTMWAADEWALAAGRHPAEVWGLEWWDVDVPDEEDDDDESPWPDQEAAIEGSMRRHPSSRRLVTPAKLLSAA